MPKNKEIPIVKAIFERHVEGKPIILRPNGKRTILLTPPERRALHDDLALCYKDLGTSKTKDQISTKITDKLRTLAGANHVKNMSKEAIAAKRAKQRKGGMSDENWKKKLGRERKENMPPAQYQKKLARNQNRKSVNGEKAAAAAHAARPRATTANMLMELSNEQKRLYPTAKKVMQAYENVFLVHNTTVLMDDLEQPLDAKYKDDPEVTLYCEKSLHESGMGPRRVRNWKPTKHKEKPHNCVYASPVVGVANWHSRLDIAAKKIIDMHVISSDNPAYDHFYQVVAPGTASNYFLKCARQVSSDAVYRGYPQENGTYVWRRIWMRDPNGPFKDKLTL